MAEYDDYDEHPLVKSLNISEAYETFTQVDIPEDEDRRNLIYMSDLALTAYRDIMNDLNNVKPESKNKMLQTALAFLSESKDARYKADSIAVQWARLNKTPNGQTGKTTPDATNNIGTEIEDGKVVDRSNLYAIAQGKKVK